VTSDLTLTSAVAAAAWLGLLTSISPCPLATNLAAVSFIGRQGGGRKALMSGLIYTLGRALAYTVVAAVLVAGVLSVPGVAQFLDRVMNRLLGPLLVVTGMFLLGLINVPWKSTLGSDELRHKAAGAGAWGAALLGALFALSFCPVSAALFFGSLLPLAVKHESGLLLPLVYGLGTAAPVLVVSVLLAWGSDKLGRAMGRIAAFDKVARTATGVVFVLVGGYYALQYLFLA
jgi:cytochrome c biogenesis protein CcdA